MSPKQLFEHVEVRGRDLDRLVGRRRRCTTAKSGEAAESRPATRQVVAERRTSRHRRLVAALPPGPGEARDDHDQADLQQQAEDRGEAAHAAHEAVTEQHAEQAGADEARGQTAEQTTAEHSAAE